LAGRSFDTLRLLTGAITIFIADNMNSSFYTFSRRILLLISLFVLNIHMLSAQNPSVNIAPEADEVITSHVSPWETLSAVNDGFDPLNSADNSNGAYGNWDGSNRQWHWVEYRWDDYYILSQSDIYWWEDGAGIVIPYETYQEYWDITEERWIPLPDAEGNGMQRDLYNITTFDPVFTNRIRVHMVSTISTGILEWRVWGQIVEFPVRSTAVADRPLEPGQTSKITITAIDGENNRVVGYPFGIGVEVMNRVSLTNELYFVAGSAVSESVDRILPDTTDLNGEVSFTVELPDVIDPGDGLAVQIFYNDILEMENALFRYLKKGAVPSEGDIVINEIMALNAYTIEDEDGEPGDWLELYNRSGVSISLEGTGISDDYDNPFRWVFPDINIYPGEFLLVWATGKDRSDPLRPLHTNFSISRYSENLLLTAPGGTRLDEIPPVPVPVDASFGRSPDGGEQLYYFSQPTPGSSNSTGILHGFLDEVTFSVEPGFYSDTVRLELLHPDPEALIYYTLDGSLPDTLATLYNTTLVITDRSGEPNQHSMITNTPSGLVAKSTVVRAVATKPDYLNSAVKTGTYFNYPEGDMRYSLAVASLATNHESLFSDTSGIYVRGLYNNYAQRSMEWERAASLEFFSEELSFQQDVGIRIHGGGTRSLPQKTLRFYARSMYGDNLFYHKLFPGQPFANYNGFILRNSGNDWGNTMFRDAAIQRIFENLNFDVQAYRPTILFINGEYWGIHNMRERYDRHYIGRVYGVDPDNIDLLTIISQNSGDVIVKEGDDLHYHAVTDFLKGNDMSLRENYEHIIREIDINNFTDYQIANIYASNADWPGNNTDFWRLRTSGDPGAPRGHDGRWRWMSYDTDFGFNMPLPYNRGGSPSHNTLAFATATGGTGWPNPEWTTFMLRSLLVNNDFKTAFINRFADLLNTFFLPGRVNTIINDMMSHLGQEMPEHIQRWRTPSNMSDWYSNVDAMTDFANQRPEYQRNHLRSYFDLGSDVEITLTVNDTAQGYVKINTIDIVPSTPGVKDNPYPWTGIYFEGNPVQVEAVPKPGYRFSHWTGTEETQERVLKFSPVADMSLSANFIQDDDKPVISYWFFGKELPNDTPLEYISPTYSLTGEALIEYSSPLPDYPYYEGHEYWRSGSMERRNAPTPLNYHAGLNGGLVYSLSEMRGIQIRQPLSYDGKHSAMILHLPTNGYEDISLIIAAKNEGAATGLLVEYSAGGENSEWSDTGVRSHIIGNVNEQGTLKGANVTARLPLEEDYRLYLIDLSDVPDATDNPDLMVRIRFEGPEIRNFDGGSVTFNNITLLGQPTGENQVTITASNGSGGEIEPAGVFIVPQGSDNTFTVTADKGYHIKDFNVNSNSLAEAEGAFLWTYTLGKIMTDAVIRAEFEPNIYSDVVIYPNPATDMLWVRFMQETSHDVVISLISTGGRVVAEKKFAGGNNMIMNMGLQDFGSGVYIARIRYGNQTIYKRVVIL
jgi:hypothetical protein